MGLYVFRTMCPGLPVLDHASRWLVGYIRYRSAGGVHRAGLGPPVPGLPCEVRRPTREILPAPKTRYRSCLVRVVLATPPTGSWDSRKRHTPELGFRHIVEAVGYSRQVRLALAESVSTLRR